MLYQMYINVMKESILENAILELANTKYECYAFKIPDQREVREGAYRKHKFMPRGIPDICLFLLRGRVVFIEVKTDVGVLSRYQKIFHAILRRFGVPIHVVRNMTEAKKLLDELTQ